MLPVPAVEATKGDAGMHVEFVFDYPNPYAYLASTQLKSLGAPIRYAPIGVVDGMKHRRRDLAHRPPAPLRVVLQRRGEAFRRGVVNGDGEDRAARLPCRALPAVRQQIEYTPYPPCPCHRRAGLCARVG